MIKSAGMFLNRTACGRFEQKLTEATCTANEKIVKIITRIQDLLQA